MQRKKRALIIGLAVLVCILALFYAFRLLGRGHAPRSASTTAPVKMALEKSNEAKSTATSDSIGRLPGPKPEQRHARRAAAHTDTSATDAASQIATSEQKAESVSVADTMPPRCKNDTTPPWVYPDPAGGLHHGKISVKLFGTKPCSIEWKTGGDWTAYTGQAIAIDSTVALWLRAVDSCGNVMAPREERYEIAPEDTVVYCTEGMEHISVGSADFCIDRYEWPNKKGAMPQAYISLYQAMDTCVAAGKRLCTSDEWTIACTGPYGWKYPYSSEFQLYACNTHDTAARPSGSKPGCRGYFGVFDMSGNLAEWTSTKSSKNIQFYNVMGGFWESGPQSGCFDVRYSYYPQNRHNPVGFRCCGGASPKPRVPQSGADRR